MKAVVFDSPGGPEVLRVTEVPDPVPGPGEVLIEVAAAGVNRADCLQRMGKYPPPPGASEILGLEFAGTVLDAPGSTRFRPGDRVMALVTGGAYASRAAVPPEVLLPVPANLGWAEAAAIPEAFLTAWLNLFELGRLRPGESVLVHAAASGVGSAALQLAREAGARVFATASAGKLDLCRALGAERAIDREAGDFAGAVRAAVPGGVDLVLDFVGAPHWPGNLAALARGGRLTLIGFLGGSRGDLDLRPILGKNLTVTGTTLRGSPLELKTRIVNQFNEFAAQRLADGRLRAVVDRTFPLAEAAEAHRHMEANRTRGKLLLLV